MVGSDGSHCVCGSDCSLGSDATVNGDRASDGLVRKHSLLFFNSIFFLFHHIETFFSCSDLLATSLLTLLPVLVRPQT